MNLLQKIFNLSGAGFTKHKYYESLNMALKRLNNEFTMLHYPLYKNESDSLLNDKNQELVLEMEAKYQTAGS